MKKLLLTNALIFLSLVGFAQTDDLQIKLDSIIKEADLLYAYEKVAWNASDLVMADESLKSKYGGYLIYHSVDTVFATFLDKTQKHRIRKYAFIQSDLNNPAETKNDQVELSELEKERLKIKIKIIEQLSNKKYKIGIPQGYNPNLVLIKEDKGYKLYIIMGTNEMGIIPFGNDYLFYTNKKGKITGWRKFHSTIIPFQTQGTDGKVVVSFIHSHLKTTPYITATDICTFRLYAEIYKIKSFSVLSTALDKTFTYIIDTNTIKVVED